jgi:uncharacterized damage-inducible protein DinB
MNERSQEMRRLFRYQEWAYAHLQSALQRAQAQMPQAALTHWCRLLSHNRRWLQLLRDEDEECRVAAACQTLQDSARLLQILADGWTQLLSEITDSELTRIITYHSSQGLPQADRLDDVLQHVLLHSAHHRGEVACLACIAADTATALDFIAFAREESAPPQDSRRLALGATARHAPFPSRR